MSKLRVTDMAVEFGIPVDEVQGLLRQMDVPVRSHLSPLTDDQVSRVRARWEREKRERAQKQAAPPAPARRRRGAATAPAPEPTPVAAPEAPVAEPVRRRRKAADVAAAAEVAAAEQAVNDAVVRRASFPTHRLAEGDRVEIIRAVAGG